MPEQIGCDLAERAPRREEHERSGRVGESRIVGTLPCTGTVTSRGSRAWAPGTGHRATPHLELPVGYFT